MIRNIFAFAIVLSLAACAAMQGPLPARPPAAPAIVLKLDDFRADRGIHPGWQQTFVFLNAHGVTASVGVIGEGLENPQVEAISWLQGQAGLGHELWNHGYCHCRTGEGDAQIREFRGASLADQQFAITRTQQLGRDQLGLTFNSFGAPYNSSDEATARALAEAEGLTSWMFKDTNNEIAPTSLQVLPRIAAVNIEYPVHIPDFEQFRNGYLAHRARPVLIIQGHPQSWVEDPERLAEFQRIIRFLIEDGAVFITPSDAAELME